MSEDDLLFAVNFADLPEIYRMRREVPWMHRMRDWFPVFVMDGERPPINPWRHAYVRAKHLREAEARLSGFIAGGSVIWSAGLDARHAAENAHWGCR